MKVFKRTIGLLAAALVLSVVPASAAQAAPFALDITDSVMDLGGLSGVKAIDSGATPPDPPATLDGDLTAGAVNVPKAGFVFPPKNAEVSPGINATINMEANEDITGTYDDSQGLLILDANLKATVAIAGFDCVISPIELTLSTDGAKPYLGVEFASGLSGPGAISAEWDSLPPVTGGGFCSTVAQLIAGPGGIWMSQDIPVAKTCEEEPANRRCNGPEEKPAVEPRIISGPESVTDSKSATFTFSKGGAETAPVTGFSCSLDGAAFEACDSGSKTYTGLAVGSHSFKVKSKNGTGEGPEASKTWSISDKVGPGGKPEFGALSIKPGNKAVKRGKKVTLTAKISNVGKAAAEGVKVCVTAPKKLVSVKKCATVGSIAAGGSASAKFKVTVKKKAKKGKKATLKFTASGKDLANKTATAKVKVK